MNYQVRASPDLDMKGCTVSYYDFEQLLQNCRDVFGPEYEFERLDRCEGGVALRKCPQDICQDDGKNVRLNLRGWPAWDTTDMTEEDKKNTELTVQHAGTRNSLIFKGDQIHWTQKEMQLMTCCVAATFGWRPKRSLGWRALKRRLDEFFIIHPRSDTVSPGDVESGTKIVC